MLSLIITTPRQQGRHHCSGERGAETSRHPCPHLFPDLHPTEFQRSSWDGRVLTHKTHKPLGTEGGAAADREGSLRNSSDWVSLSESWDAPETFKLLSSRQFTHPASYCSQHRVRKVSHPPAQVPPSLHPSSSDEAGPLMGWSQVTSIHPSKSRNPLHCVASMTVNKGCCHFPEGRAGESAWPSIKPSCSRNCYLW